MSTVSTCSADRCPGTPTEALALRGLPGHVHDCTQCAAAVREFCDVVASEPITDGQCPIVGCTGDRVTHVSRPTLLEEPW